MNEFRAPCPKRQATKLPPGVKRQQKNGRDYYYHRKTWTRLPGTPWSPEMMAAVEAIEAKIAAEAPATLPNTVAAVGISYLNSPAFNNGSLRSPASRALRRRVIEDIIKNYGHLTLGERDLDHRLCVDMFEGAWASAKPGWSRVYLSGFRAFIAHAIKLGLRKTDPTEGIRRQKLHNPDGIATWSEEDIAAFRARWPLGTTERLSLEMLLWTVQRRGDAISFGRQHVKKLLARSGSASTPSPMPSGRSGRKRPAPLSHCRSSLNYRPRSMPCRCRTT